MACKYFYSTHYIRLDFFKLSFPNSFAYKHYSNNKYADKCTISKEVQKNVRVRKVHHFLLIEYEYNNKVIVVFTRLI